MILNMFNFNPSELTVSFEWKLQVAVNDKLVETLRVACIRDTIQFKLHRGAAATRRRGVYIAKYTACSEKYGWFLFNLLCLFR